MLMLPLLVACTTLKCTLGALDIEGLSRECYAQPGDILLGYLPRARGGQDQPCTGRVGLARLRAIQAFKYGIEKAKKDADILPNITVGFVMLDTCGTTHGTVGQSLFYLPTEDAPSTHDVHSCSAQSPVKHHYRVVGVVGPKSSEPNKFLVPALGVVDIPVIGPLATSDDLLEKAAYPNFYSLSPPDRYQTQMILQFLAHFNWTYFALVYSEGSYGENAAKEIHRTIDQYGLCLAESFMIYQETNQRVLPGVLAKLDQMTNVRAIVIFFGDSSMRHIIRLIDELGLFGRFVLIGADSFALGNQGPAANWGFFIHFPEVTDHGFNDALRSQSPASNPENLWMREYWQDYYGCSWSLSTDEPPQMNTTCESDVTCAPMQTDSPTIPSCYQYENNNDPLVNATAKWFDYKFMDAAYMLTLGIDALLRDKCPEVFMNVTLLESCFSGREYIEALGKVRFNGTSGYIAFDSEGNVEPAYLIRQRLPWTGRYGDIVASWDQKSGLNVNRSLIDWSLFANYSGFRLRDDGVPQSVCSQPCLPRQYLIAKEQLCCWECRYCRNNEVIINGTSCQVCEENTWPDDVSGLICQPITAIYLHWSDNLGCMLVVLSSFGLFLTMTTLKLIIKYRNVKLIKASSRELSILILAGILLAFVSTYFYVIPPHPVTCFLRDFGFSVSVTSIYAPMLMKANRVYRIFAAGRKGQQFPAFISTRSQIFFASLLIVVQILLTCIVSAVLPSREVQRMPILIEKYSESLCDVPVEALISRISFNLVLLVVCSAFGFLTRKLPENFNESQFIFISVTTTVFIWLVFLPTYFTSFYAYHQASLLALCLILNGSITLVCLFFPKLYAVHFVDEKKLKFITMSSSVATESTTVQ